MVLGTVQVAQSCKMLEMHADIKPAAGTADAYDFAIVGANEAIAALRCADLVLTSHECRATLYVLKAIDIHMLLCCPAYMRSMAPEGMRR